MTNSPETIRVRHEMSGLFQVTSAIIIVALALTGWNLFKQSQPDQVLQSRLMTLNLSVRELFAYDAALETPKQFTSDDRSSRMLRVRSGIHAVTELSLSPVLRKEMHTMVMTFESYEDGFISDQINHEERDAYAQDVVQVVNRVEAILAQENDARKFRAEAFFVMSAAVILGAVLLIARIARNPLPWLHV